MICVTDAVRFWALPVGFIPPLVLGLIAFYFAKKADRSQRTVISYGADYILKRGYDTEEGSRFRLLSKVLRLLALAWLIGGLVIVAILPPCM